jgi:DNA-binding CsgD family transcriptional regulator
MAAHSSLWVERFGRCEMIFDRLVGALRQASAVNALPHPLAARSHLAFRLGRWPSALADADEAVRLAADTGQELLLAHALGALAEVEAALGHDERAAEHAERCVALAQAQGAHATAIYGHGALAFLSLGRGLADEAVAHGLAAERAEARTDNDEPGIVRYAPDLIEALWRAGRTDEALERLERLETQARRPHHTWAQAVCARLRGLLGEDDELDGWFARAVELHAQTPQIFEAARTHLVHGERLRRARRRSDAREPLQRAAATFERLGAVAWAERAAAELRATGGRTVLAAVPAPAVGVAAAPSAAIAELTPQELQIALHAARGMTNREVGAALFLAPKTVEHHLSRTFRKLGIRRRVELAGALGPAAEARAA